LALLAFVSLFLRRHAGAPELGWRRSPWGWKARASVLHGVRPVGIVGVVLPQGAVRGGSRPPLGARLRVAQLDPPAKPRAGLLRPAAHPLPRPLAGRLPARVVPRVRRPAAGRAGLLLAVANAPHAARRQVRRPVGPTGPRAASARHGTGRTQRGRRAPPALAPVDPPLVDQERVAARRAVAGRPVARARVRTAVARARVRTAPAHEAEVALLPAVTRAARTGLERRPSASTTRVARPGRRSPGCPFRTRSTPVSSTTAPARSS